MMKKIFTLAAATLVAALAAHAVPAKRGVRTCTQPDGSTIQLSLVGDENIHSYMTVDGLTVGADEDGTFRYVVDGTLTDVKASDIDLRGEAELRFIDENASLMTFEAKAAKMRALNINTPARTRAAAPAKRSSQVPQTGSPRVPVILVQYSDIKFNGSDPHKTFVDFFDNGDKSARQYFVDQSNGKYTPQFDVYGPYTLPQNRAYYGGNNAYGNDKRVGTMVAEGCKGLDSEIDYRLYDNDGDGQCDVMIVIYAGVGEAASSVANSIWPCQWDLASSDYGSNLRLDGITISKFAVFNETNGTSSTKLDGIGTFCHEYSHCLDLPDFYDTEYSGKFFGMANWSLLDYGCYNDNGYTPIGYSAYEKSFMGWIDVPEAVENTYYALPIFNQKSLDTDKAVKITNAKDKNEYYILENRSRKGWDKYIPTSGMLITHVTYSASAWANNTVNNYAMQRMTPIPADGELKMIRGYPDDSSLLGDLWPYKTATELTDTSKPAAKVNTGGYMGKPVTGITRNTNGMISFWFMKADKPTLDTPAMKDATEITTNSFKANWAHTSLLVDCTYTLEVRSHQESEATGVISTDFSSNPAQLGGWIGDDAGYNKYDSVNKALRLGSTTKFGGITSPEFTTDASGAVSVALKARSYNTDTGVTMRVSVLNTAGDTVDSQDVLIDSQDAEYTCVLSADPATRVKVRVETTAIKKRVLLSSVAVYTGDIVKNPLSIRRAQDETVANVYRTIEGIKTTSYVVTDLPEGGSYDVRVCAVPVDPTAAFESAWTKPITVILGSTGVGSVEADNDAPVEYFNLQGIRVENPSASGIYIRRQGTKVAKVLVK